MIQLYIRKTFKEFGNKSKWLVYDDKIENFSDLVAAKLWLNEQYGKHKKQSMYSEGKDNTSKHVGYVYCFRTDTSYEQHWVTFRRVEMINPVKGD